MLTAVIPRPHGFPLRADSADVDPAYAAARDQGRCKGADSQAGGHAKTTETRNVKQTGDLGVPTDDRAPVWREGPEAGPATAQVDVLQSRSMLQQFFREEVCRLRIDGRNTGRMLKLITRTDEQAGSFWPQVISDIQIPHKRRLARQRSGVPIEEKVPARGFNGRGDKGWRRRPAQAPPASTTT